MKVTRQLSSLEPLVLDPLEGISASDWTTAPPGKWNIAQIVEHLAIAFDLVATGFAALPEVGTGERVATPAQSVLRHTLLGSGEFPPGMKAPDISQPSDAPDPELVVARFRMGVEHTRALVEDWPQERQLSSYLRHPVLGDLNLPEWVRYHFVHCTLHSRQIEKRLNEIRQENEAKH
jgi:hypothetical protein